MVRFLVSCKPEASKPWRTYGLQLLSYVFQNRKTRHMPKQIDHALPQSEPPSLGDIRKLMGNWTAYLSSFAPLEAQKNILFAKYAIDSESETLVGTSDKR